MSSSASTLSLRRSVALVWRSLRSMRTALILLLLLALAAIAGSLVPQVANSPLRVASMFRDHPLRAQIYDALGLFDVYGSWWFTLIYTLLLVSLGACLFPRTRAMIRNLRARPQPARELDALRHYAEVTVPVTADRAVEISRSTLRRRLFRVHRRDDGAPALAADKGLAREAGSLLFHWAFLLILVGVVWGKGTGFTGQAVVVEGQTWTEAQPSYDGQLHTGRFFDGHHTGIQIKLDRFAASYRIPSGIPRDFVSTVELFRPDGTAAGTVDVRVNHPAELDGVKIYQFGYGWAPVIDVQHDGEPLVSGPTVCRQPAPPSGVSSLQLPWDCVVKLPTLTPQVGIRFTLWPDARALNGWLTTGKLMPMLSAYDPVMTFVAYEGDLRSDLALPSNELDTATMRRFTDGVVGAGQTKTIGRGITVSFPDLRRYSVFEIKRDRGLGILLSAAILILLGLLPALYTSRRKLWVTAEPAPAGGSGSLVKVAGFALQRRPQFDEEFDRLVRALAPPPGHRPVGGEPARTEREEVRT